MLPNFYTALMIQEASVHVSVMAGAHRDCLVLDSNAQWPEIQHLVSQDQINSTDPPLLTDGQTLAIIIHVS